MREVCDALRMLIADLVAAVEHIAPSRYAESWDNTGLILGDRARPIDGPVLLAIDFSPAVCEEAVKLRASAIIAYHPPIFSPIRRLTGESPRGAALLRAAASSIAVYSPHTALDAAPGGIADWLLDCALHDAPPATVSRTDPKNPQRRALVPHGSSDPARTHKLVTFVPAEPPGLIEAIREALAKAGAGRIGEYDSCSFNVRGTGTFRGSEKSNPALGERGRLESVEELRLEMVCPARALPDVIAALRRAHPYEEPAFDVYRLEPAPEAAVGAGRIGTLGAPCDLKSLAARIRRNLGVGAVQVADAGGARDAISRVAVCPGSGSALLAASADAGAQVFITGEMKHHDVLEALDRGVSVILAGHTETERGYLPHLGAALGARLPGARWIVSAADRAPLATI